MVVGGEVGDAAGREWGDGVYGVDESSGMRSLGLSDASATMTMKGVSRSSSAASAITTHGGGSMGG